MNAQHTSGPWLQEGASGIRCAEGWLVAQAWPHPKVDGPMARNARLIALSTVIPDLYASEINASINWFWDGGFDVAVGDMSNGVSRRGNCDTWVEALEWLQSAAIAEWPDSDFATLRRSSHIPSPDVAGEVL